MGDMLLRQGDQLDEARIVVIERTLLLRHVLLRARRNSFPSIEQPVPYRVRNGSGLPEQPPWQGFRYCYLVHIGKTVFLNASASASASLHASGILAAPFFLGECVAPSLSAPRKFFSARWVPYFPPAARGNFFRRFLARCGAPEVLLVFRDISLHQAGLRMGGAADWPASEISVYG